MAEAALTIHNSGRNWRLDLGPAGAVIGRNPSCDVVLAGRDVSRRHARVFLGPSACWMVEDLGSSNGTFVNGRRIESSPIVPGDIVGIGCASLSLEQQLMARTDATVVVPGPNIIVMDFGTEVFYSTPKLEDCRSQPCPERLDRASRCLARQMDLMSIYVEACRALAEGPKTAAAVFPALSGDRPLPKTPEVLAYHFGGSLEDTRMEPADSWYPSHQAFRVSHRLLDRVRTDRQALMTKSIFSCDPEVTVSLIDGHSPRALICAFLDTQEEGVILLYVDVPIDEHIGPGPEEMFAFVQAIAHHVHAAASRISRKAERVP